MLALKVLPNRLFGPTLAPDVRFDRQQAVHEIVAIARCSDAGADNRPLHGKVLIFHIGIELTRRQGSTGQKLANQSASLFENDERLSKLSTALCSA